MSIHRQSFWLFFFAALFVMIPFMISRTTDRSGSLLVAKEIMAPPFDKSIVYIYERSLESAAGIVVNKQLSETDYARLPSTLKDKDIKVGYGGPIDFPDKIFVLEEIEKPEGTKKGLYTIMSWDDALKAKPDLLELIEKAQQREWEKYKVVVGYASWGFRQLDEEVTEQRAWYVLPPDHNIIFQTNDKADWDFLNAQEKAKINTQEPRLGD